MVTGMNTHTSVGVQHLRTVEDFSLSALQQLRQLRRRRISPCRVRIGGAGIESQRRAANIPMTTRCIRFSERNTRLTLGPKSHPAEILELSHFLQLLWRLDCIFMPVCICV